MGKASRICTNSELCLMPMLNKKKSAKKHIFFIWFKTYLFRDFSTRQSSIQCRIENIKIVFSLKKITYCDSFVEDMVILPIEPKTSSVFSTCNIHINRIYTYIHMNIMHQMKQLLVQTIHSSKEKIKNFSRDTQIVRKTEHV